MSLRHSKLKPHSRFFYASRLIPVPTVRSGCNHLWRICFVIHSIRAFNILHIWCLRTGRQKPYPVTGSRSLLVGTCF